jgi:hypothetical protein
MKTFNSYRITALASLTHCIPGMTDKIRRLCLAHKFGITHFQYDLRSTNESISKEPRGLNKPTIHTCYVGHSQPYWDLLDLQRDTRPRQEIGGIRLWTAAQLCS